MKKNLSTKLVILTALLAIGILGYIVLKPDSKNDSNTTSKAAQSTIQTYSFTVSDGKITSGSSSLTVNKGDTVSLSVTTDHEDELHLHGYDKELELVPGQAGRLEFIADTTGEFEVELHHSELQLTTITVK